MVAAEGTTVTSTSWPPIAAQRGAARREAQLKGHMGVQPPSKDVGVEPRKRIIKRLSSSAGRKRASHKPDPHRSACRLGRRNGRCQAGQRTICSCSSWWAGTAQSHLWSARVGGWAGGGWGSVATPAIGGGGLIGSRSPLAAVQLVGQSAVGMSATPCLQAAAVCDCWARR